MPGRQLTGEVRETYDTCYPVQRPANVSQWLSPRATVKTSFLMDVGSRGICRRTTLSRDVQRRSARHPAALSRSGHIGDDHVEQRGPPVVGAVFEQHARRRDALTVTALVEHHDPAELPNRVQSRIPRHQPGTGQRVEQHVHRAVGGTGVVHRGGSPARELNDLAGRHVRNGGQRGHLRSRGKGSHAGVRNSRSRR